VTPDQLSELCSLNQRLSLVPLSGSQFLKLALLQSIFLEEFGDIVQPGETVRLHRVGVNYAYIGAQPPEFIVMGINPDGLRLSLKDSLHIQHYNLRAPRKALSSHDITLQEVR
jgi:hypothetical protein